MAHRREEVLPRGAAGERGRSSAPSGDGPEPDDEVGLWRRLRNHGDGAARALLVDRYVPFAKAVGAKLYARRGTSEVEFEEYQQLAMVGLLEAVDRYQPELGARFTTFSLPRIRGAVLNGLARMTEQRQQRAYRRQLASERVRSLLPDHLSADPSQELLDELEGIGVGIALGFLLEGGGGGFGIPHAEDAYAQLEVRQVHAQLWDMVKLLPDREREIVSRHYRDGKRFEEVAGELQLSKGRISQIHREAMTHLRALIRKAERCDVAF